MGNEKDRHLLSFMSSILPPTNQACSLWINLHINPLGPAWWHVSHCITLYLLISGRNLPWEWTRKWYTIVIRDRSYPIGELSYGQIVTLSQISYDSYIWLNSSPRHNWFLMCPKLNIFLCGYTIVIRNRTYPIGELSYGQICTLSQILYDSYK